MGPKATAFTCPKCGNGYASTEANAQAPICSLCGTRMERYVYTAQATSHEHIKRVLKMTAEEIIRREG
jgi:hypothetical protein